MATITTRAAKGSALTFTEVDNNFTNLNADGISNTNNIATNTSAISTLQTDKFDKSGGTISGSLVVTGSTTTNGVTVTGIETNTQAGSNVTINLPTKEILRITSGSLVSISGIAAGSNGQKIVIVNRTGVSVELQNESGSATAANRIYSGTGGNITLNNNASISAIYDGSAARWNVIASTGAGSIFVAAVYTNSAGTAITTSYTVKPFPTLVLDTHSAYNTTTGVWTCPLTGRYRAMLRSYAEAAAYSTTNGLTVVIRKNGTDVASALRYGNGSSIVLGESVSTTMDCSSGDTIDFIVRSSTLTAMYADSEFNQIEIVRVD